jgi:IclR family transcriptional regulator, acetate operon repressor
MKTTSASATTARAGDSKEIAGVRVLHKTLDILEILKSRDAGYTLADLTRSVALPKATVYRILATLEKRGYLDRSPGNAYRLAARMFDLQRQDSLEQTLNRVAQPVMEHLVETYKETVNLGVLNAGEVVVINTVESRLGVRMASKIGNRRHLHTTALGKCFLAGLADKEIARMVRVKGLPRFTEKTITTKAGLMAEIARVRRAGYAIDNQENELDGRCIGAPVADQEGRVLAAVSISGPTFRMEMSRVKSLAPALKTACAEIAEAVRRG